MVSDLRVEKELDKAPLCEYNIPVGRMLTLGRFRWMEFGCPQNYSSIAPHSYHYRRVVERHDFADA